MKLEKKDKSLLFSSTEIPDVFFTEYLPLANGDFVKVYIYLLFLSNYDKEANPHRAFFTHFATITSVDEGEEELAGLTGHTIAGILVILRGSLQRHFLESTDIHGQIVPAGLIELVVHILLLHQVDDRFSIEDTVTVGVREGAHENVVVGTVVGLGGDGGACVHKDHLTGLSSFCGCGGAGAFSTFATGTAKHRKNHTNHKKKQDCSFHTIPPEDGI